MTRVHFNASDGKPGDEALIETCLPGHEQTKTGDLVFAITHPDAGN